MQAADLRRIQEGIRSRVVGRVEDTQLLLATLGAGRDLLLEGPPGTSKSTILCAVADLSGSTLHTSSSRHRSISAAVRTTRNSPSERSSILNSMATAASA